MGVADNIMVGRLGAAQLAACGISNSVYFVIAVIGSGALSVVSPMVAGSQSKKGDDKPGNILFSAYRASLYLSAGIIAILVFLCYGFEWLGQPEEVTALSQPYLFIITLSTLPMYLFWAGKQFTDGLGYTKTAMRVTIIGLIVNVFLNWFFIFGLWIMPGLGLLGAGISTFISRCLMAWIMYRFIKNHTVFKSWIQDARVFTHQVKRIIKLGLPSGMQYFFEMAAFGSAAIIVGWLGTSPLAAHQIAINLAAVTYMIASGISAAAAIRVGNAASTGIPGAVIKAGTSALILTIAVMGIAGIIFMFLRTFLVRLYINDSEVIEIASSLLIIVAAFQLSDGIQVTGLGILRGIMDIYIPTLMTLIAYWGIGIPLGYYLARYQDMGVSGIWYGLLAGLSCSAIMLTYRFYKLGRSIRK